MSKENQSEENQAEENQAEENQSENNTCNGYALRCKSIYKSIFYHHNRCLKKYIEDGVDINKEETEENCGFGKYTLPISFLGKARPLSLAFIFNNLEGMEILLENGANPNFVVTDNENTLIHMACFSLKPEYVTLLLKYNSDISTKNKYGEFPLTMVKNTKYELEGNLPEDDDPCNINTSFPDIYEDLHNAKIIINLLENYSSSLDIKEPSEEVDS